MIFKKLGNTSMTIPAIGQGMGMVERPRPGLGEDAKRIYGLKMGIDLGMNFIDTAEIYADGYSEELVAEAVRGIRKKVILATKVSPENLSYKNILKSLEASLRRMKTDYIDLYQIHWPNPKIPLDETTKALKELVAQGKVKYIGICNFTLKELKEIELSLSKDILVSIQVEYNLLDRTIENDVLPYCDTKSLTVIAYSPLMQGRIASGDKKIEILKKIADKSKKTIAQITLNWLIGHQPVIVIPKAANPAHIKENAQAADFNLDKDDFDEINYLFKQEIIYVPVDKIRVIEDGKDNHRVYKTIEEAVENRLGFVPSPKDLASDIKKRNVLKPIRVKKSTAIEQYDYDLIEGRIRYWAWVIAHGDNKPVPVFIRED